MGKDVPILSSRASEDDSIEFTDTVAGAEDVLLKKTVQSPYQYVLVNGEELIADIRDGSDDPIKDGDIVLAVSPPDTRDQREVDEKDLRTYAELSQTEQRQSDFRSQVAYEVENGELVVPTDHEILVLVDSSTGASASNSFVEIGAVREANQ